MKSSTEAELVGVDDVMPQVIWTWNFLEAQGYSITDNVVFQDNQSAMLLEWNRKQSSGKHMRHIDIRYFFITDRIEAGEVRVDYCPTGEMTVDYFMKPLQGATFKKFRNQVMHIMDAESIKYCTAVFEEGSDAQPNKAAEHHRSVLGEFGGKSEPVQSEWTVVPA
jgi:hypothetical protein